MIAKLDQYQTSSLSILRGLWCESFQMKISAKKNLFSQPVYM